jgi:hypothetical protein
MKETIEKGASYENVTRPQIVKVTGYSKLELSYEVTTSTTNNPKTTFICTIARFNNLYVKL